MKRLSLFLCVVAFTASGLGEPAPQETVESLCGALIGAMKKGSSLDFAARRRLLSPEIEKDLNLPLMTRIVVGYRWQTLSAEEKQGLVQAFSDFSIANYANRFSSFSGERFEVERGLTSLPNGDVIVKSSLVPKGGDPIHLDYLMRKGDGTWKVIDVFLSGTISELAARRSEYSAVLKKDGANGLIALLRKKADTLSE